MHVARFFESQLDNQFQLIRNVLNAADINNIIETCRQNLAKYDAIPCYAYIDEQRDAVLGKVKTALEASIGSELFYLNDCYIYTNGATQAQWHMDTEHFTFGHSCNAWIMLSPDEIESPLAMMRDVNEPQGDYYHAAELRDAQCTLTNYKSGDQTRLPLQEIESGKIEAPNVRAGDILLFNPQRFHRTNTPTPKHVLSMKFVAKSANGFSSKAQVPDALWPETKIFNKLLGRGGNWDDFLGGVSQTLETETGRICLSAGHFPERTRLYQETINTLSKARQREQFANMPMLEAA